MAIVYDKLLALKIPDVEHSYAPEDCMLYALGLGLGQDPDRTRSSCRSSTRSTCKVLPTMAGGDRPSRLLGEGPRHRHRLGQGRAWRARPDAAQAAAAVAAPSSARPASLEVIDKGPGKGALVYSQRTIDDKASGERIATIAQTTFCRGDGGFGGPPREQPAAAPDPGARARLVCDLPTRPEMALLYRLYRRPEPAARRSGGRQGRGLSAADPARARDLRRRRPRASSRAMCGYDPARFTAIAGRFSAPVFPGETIRTEMWREGAVVSFRARVVERDVIALNNGRAEVELTLNRAGIARHDLPPADPTRRNDRPRRSAESARARAVRRISPANTGASSTASAAIRPSSSTR